MMDVDGSEMDGGAEDWSPEEGGEVEDWDQMDGGTMDILAMIANYPVAG